MPWAMHLRVLFLFFDENAFDDFLYFFSFRLHGSYVSKNFKTLLLQIAAKSFQTSAEFPL